MKINADFVHKNNVKEDYANVPNHFILDILGIANIKALAVEANAKQSGKLKND